MAAAARIAANFTCCLDLAEWFYGLIQGHPDDAINTFELIKLRNRDMMCLKADAFGRGQFEKLNGILTLAQVLE